MSLHRVHSVDAWSSCFHRILFIEPPLNFIHRFSFTGILCKSAEPFSNLLVASVVLPVTPSVVPSWTARVRMFSFDCNYHTITIHYSESLLVMPIIQPNFFRILVSNSRSDLLNTLAKSNTQELNTENSMCSLEWIQFELKLNSALNLDFDATVQLLVVVLNSIVSIGVHWSSLFWLTYCNEFCWKNLLEHLQRVQCPLSYCRRLTSEPVKLTLSIGVSIIITAICFRSHRRFFDEFVACGSRFNRCNRLQLLNQRNSSTMFWNQLSRTIHLE